MDNKLLTKVIFVAGLIILAIWQLYPNFVWYSLPLQQRQERARLKDDMAKDVIPLGLDLQGGVHLVYQLETDKLPDLSEATVQHAIDQNIVVINNRVNALGLANPVVIPQGKDFIMVQLPGVFESEQAKQIIGKTALLEFRLVVDDPSILEITQKIIEANIKPEQVSRQELPKDILELIPEKTLVFPGKEGGYYLVSKEVALTGKYLTSALVNTGNQSTIGGLSIDFELNSEGAVIFEALTGAHINEKLAIVLDGIIQSAPNIQTRIPGGRGQITGSFTVQEAKLISNILNSGKLEAPMKVVEERTVGPEMGEDSIKAGLSAVLIGFLLVVIFILLYYKVSGAIADVALILNLVLLMSVMAMLRATLTMPGIAGIILSLAMAIDANVLIFERVREESAKGKNPKFALDEGYEKAFSAIVDGNLTTLFAALFLFQFGSLPLRGFAITLIIGLLVSMFTAVFVTRMIYELWFSIKPPKKLSV